MRLMGFTGPRYLSRSTEDSSGRVAQNPSLEGPIFLNVPVFLITKIRYNEVMVTEADIFKALRGGKVALPPLKVSLLERAPRLRVFADDSYRPDALVEASRERRRWKFLAEFKAAATPQAFANALAAVVPAAKKARLNPMIILPYLSPENLARLEETEVSGLDLCGNGLVTVSDEVFVMRTGEPNRFPRSEPIRNVYRGDSSLVGRVFLAKPTYRTVGEIVRTIQEKGGSVSFATVSKVLKTLEADLLVSRSEKGIRLLQADKLLDQLAVNYRPPKILERFVGKVALSEGELPRALANAARRIGSRFVMTGAASADRYSVLAREPVVAAYCASTPTELLTALKVEFEQTDRFPNIDLICTEDSPTYFESVSQKGVEYASPVQTYLEMMSGDKRQRETAEQVREYILRRIREYRETL